MFGITRCLRVLLAFLLTQGDQPCSFGRIASSSAAQTNISKPAEKVHASCMLSHIDFHSRSDTTSFTDLMAHFRTLIEKCAQNSTIGPRDPQAPMPFRRPSLAEGSKKARQVRQAVDRPSPLASLFTDSKLVVHSEDSNMTIAQLVHIESGESSISFSLWETHISIRAEKLNLSVSPVQQIITFVLTRPRLFVQRDGCDYNFSSPFSNLSIQPSSEGNGTSSGISVVVTSHRWDFCGQCDASYFKVTNSSTTVATLKLSYAMTPSPSKFLSLAKHPKIDSAFLFATTGGLILEAELRDAIIVLEQNALQLVYMQVPSKLDVRTQKYKLLGSGDDFIANMSNAELLLHYGNSQIRTSSSAILSASFVNARMIVSVLNSSRMDSAQCHPESPPAAELDVQFGFLNLTIEPVLMQIMISTFNSSTTINRQTPSIKIMSNYSTMKLNSTVHVIHIYTGSWLQIMSTTLSMCPLALPATQEDKQVSNNNNQPVTHESIEFLEVSDQEPLSLNLTTDETADNATQLISGSSSDGSFVDAGAPALAPLEDNFTVQGMSYLHQADSLESELFPVQTTVTWTSTYLTDAVQVAIESEIINIQEVNSNKVKEKSTSTGTTSRYDEMEGQMDEHFSLDGLGRTEKSPTSRRALSWGALLPANASAFLFTSRPAVNWTSALYQSSGPEGKRNLSMYKSKLLTVTVNGTIRPSESNGDSHRRVKRGLEYSFQKAQQREQSEYQTTKAEPKLKALPPNGENSNKRDVLAAEILKFIDLSNPAQNETQILFLIRRGKTAIDAWQAKKTYDYLNETELEAYLSYEIVQPIIPWEASLMTFSVTDSSDLYKTVISSLSTALGMILCLSLLILLYIIARTQKRRRRAFITVKERSLPVE